MQKTTFHKLARGLGTLAAITGLSLLFMSINNSGVRAQNSTARKGIDNRVEVVKEVIFQYPDASS
jgi:hypothetical protein